jgi:membrane protease subunit HflK
MIDAKTGNNTIYLPLDRLLAQSTANEAARSAGSGPVMAPQNPAQPAQQTQAQPQSQPQAPAAPAQPEASSSEPNRTHDLRSRDTGRERESR